MLYQLLSGQQPYVPAGARLTSHAVWALVQSGPPQALSEIAPRAPAELVAICERAMAREARLRYPDMSAVAADLSAFIEGRVVKAYETGAWAEARKWVLRNRSLAAALGVALLLLVVGLVSSLLLKAQSDANAQLAGIKAAEALDQQRLAREETAKVLRLSDIKVLQELATAADALWPPHPGNISALEAWLERGRALAARLPEHRAPAESMRAHAHEWSAEERAHDARTHPRAGELEEDQAEMASLAAQLDAGLAGQERAGAEERIAELEPRIEELTDEVTARRTWRLDSPEEQWQHDVVTELIDGLERFESGLLAADAVEPEHGWSVPKRLAFARTLAAGFGEGGAWNEAWSKALPALRAAYPGLAIQPQMGLAPIGPDPDSGLWEFAHLASGEPARRGPDGRVSPREADGLVLVLIPGGTFWMGAQASDRSQHNFDPEAQQDEGPVHEIELSPFFISKYEMTRAQWLRLTGKNPSFYQAGPYTPTLLHPIEQVSWQDCTTWLGRAGLALPTEAQWECAARGGTDTPWWTGAERASLSEARAANLADQSAARAGAPWGDIADWPDFDDGYPLHAPIGTFSANPFGLHEVTGNLWEWCQDGLLHDFFAQSPEKDPVAVAGSSVPRVSRGGSFDLAARFARSTSRGRRMPSYSDSYLGVRPARALDP
jgi:formylglycine-generating enzyme required for sulfatase activity